MISKLIYSLTRIHKPFYYFILKFCLNIVIIIIVYMINIISKISKIRICTKIENITYSFYKIWTTINFMNEYRGIPNIFKFIIRILATSRNKTKNLAHSFKFIIISIYSKIRKYIKIKTISIFLYWSIFNYIIILRTLW